LPRKRTPYEIGREREYHIADMLRDEGYLVMRTAGSHSPFDLVAVNGEQVRFVQVQTKMPTPTQISALREIEVPECATKEIIYKHGRKYAFMKVP